MRPWCMVAPAQLYVAVTTAVTTALISIAEEERLVDKLAAHLRAVNEFNTLVAWWRSLSSLVGRCRLTLSNPR